MPVLPRPSLRNRALVAAWLAWCGWAVTHYFVVPDTLFNWRDPGELFPPAYAGEAARRGLLALIGAGAVTLAAWAAGALLLRRTAAMFTSWLERLIVELALGFGALSSAFLLLAFAGWFRPALVRVVTLALACAAVIQVPRSVLRLRHALRVPRLGPRGLLLTMCGVAACGFAFSGALAPEIEYDALWYHLWLPERWLAAGRPVDIVHEYISLYPLTWELLFGAAMTLGGPVAAKLLHFVSLTLLAVTTALFGARWFPRSSPGVAAALVVTAPLVIWEGTTAYIDLALAWYVAAAAYALLRHDETRDLRWLVLGALFMGIALSIKNLGLVAFAVIGLVLFARELTRRSFSTTIRVCALFGALSLLVPSPWYARAWRASGNPVFPDLYGNFGARPPERWNSEADRMLRAFKDRFGGNLTAGDLVKLPWDVTMHGSRYGGTLGPVFLILVPVALAATLRPGRARAPTLVLSAALAAYVAIWASPFSSLQLRFLVPVVPFLAVLAAEGLRRLPDGASIVVAMLLVLNLPPFIEWHEADRRGWTGWLTHTMRRVPLPVLVGAESQDDYLARQVPSYRAWRYLDAHAGSRVLTFSGGDHLYSHVERLWSDAPLAREATWGTAAGREPSAREALLRLGVTHVMFDLRQMGEGKVGTLAIGTPAMRDCCLEKVYDDGRFAVYRVR